MVGLRKTSRPATPVAGVAARVSLTQSVWNVSLHWGRGRDIPLPWNQCSGIHSLTVSMSVPAESTLTQGLSLQPMIGFLDKHIAVKPATFLTVCKSKMLQTELLNFLTCLMSIFRLAIILDGPDYFVSYT